MRYQPANKSLTNRRLKSHRRLCALNRKQTLWPGEGDCCPDLLTTDIRASFVDRIFSTENRCPPGSSPGQALSGKCSSFRAHGVPVFCNDRQRHWRSLVETMCALLPISHSLEWEWEMEPRGRRESVRASDPYRSRAPSRSLSRTALKTEVFVTAKSPAQCPRQAGHNSTDGFLAGVNGIRNV